MAFNAPRVVMAISESRARQIGNVSTPKSFRVWPYKVVAAQYDARA